MHIIIDTSIYPNLDFYLEQELLIDTARFNVAEVILKFLTILYTPSKNSDWGISTIRLHRFHTFDLAWV